MAYRFVHAADIHLDSPLKTLALRDPAIAELVGDATRRAFVGIIDLCIAEKVDALLIAGDLYDGEQTSMKTALFLSDQLGRLHGAGVATYIIRGNHDALSKITKELTLPESVRVFGGRADCVEVVRARGAMPVAIHGMSFAQPKAPDSLLPKYRAPVAGAVNIGLMHTSLAGAPGHDSYAPTSISDLQGAGFSYWALGHIHKRALIEKNGAYIVMAGIPQGRDINEAGAKSVTLVSVGDDGALHCEERFTSIAQFERIDVDLTGVDDWREALGLATVSLDAMRKNVGSEHLVARLRLSGVTSLAWRLRRDPDLLKTDLGAQGAYIDKCWIEKIEIDCKPSGASAEIGASDPVVMLRRLMEEDVLASHAFQQEISVIVKELQGQLPVERRAFLGADEAAFAARTAEFAREGIDDVIARLQGGRDGVADNAS